MKIKRKHTDHVIGGSYVYWRDEILAKHVQENYEILSEPDIVDVFQIDVKTGKKEFVDTIDRYIAQQQYLEKSDTYTIVPTTAKFDSNYKMTRRPKGSAVGITHNQRYKKT